MMAQATPLQIGPYEIFEEIGRGGMSIVYRARDTRNARIVALKVLPPEFHHQRHLLNRFVKEGQSTLRLEHPNIVRTFEADIANDTYFMAMELVQGENLSDYLKRRQGPLPFDDVIRILHQVASGLDYAHAQGILHRDIKPSNIMLNHDGRALITDFGVARDLGGDATLVTMPGHSVGTPAYMSPEQAQGDQNVDSRSDIYSLGVVAYAMLTGNMPFDATSQIALLRKIIDASPTPPESINPQINPSIARALTTVLSKNPQARYATAELFVQALEGGIAEGTSPKREPDKTVPVMLAAAPATNTPTVNTRRIAPPRRTRNPLLIAAAQSQRRNANASSTAKPIARQYILKPTGAKGGKNRLVMAYVLGGALLVVVLLVVFLVRDRFSGQNPSAVTEVALVATPQSDTSTPTPLPPTPTPEPTTEATIVSEEVLTTVPLVSDPLVSDSGTISDSVVEATETQATQEAATSNPTPEPTRVTKTPAVRVLPAPGARAISPATPTNTPADPLPTNAPASTPTTAATSTTEPTPSPEVEAPTDAASTPASVVALVDATPTSTVSPTPASTDTPEPISTPTNTALPLPSVTPTTKPTTIPATLPTATSTPAPGNTPVEETPLPGATKTNQVDGATYVYVPAGKFSMGSTRADDEKPLHAVEINAFWMMQTEVTNAQYALCITDGACTPPLNERIDDPDYADHPVTNIDWGQASIYAEWAGGRLPTEVEWEVAARGTDQRPFPWGDTAPDESLLNFASTINDTTPVAEYPLGVSPYGLYDMAGNVEEWVGDWYADDYYAASPAQNPPGPAEGIFRVVRGGSYHSDANLVLTTTRGKAAPNRGYASVGFRVVLDD